MRGEFEACIRSGGVALFPADTVYGLACDAEDAAAVARLYALKGRAPDKPAAVMFFDVERLPPLTPRVAAAARKLLPGPVTLIVPNPEGLFPLAGGDALGLRVPAGSPLAGADVAVLQSSANHAGGPDAKTVDEVPEDIRTGADLVLDAGSLPGVASAVLDLTRYEESGDYRLLRRGPGEITP